MPYLSARCSTPGPLAKTIPTTSFVGSLLARLSAARFRW